MSLRSCSSRSLRGNCTLHPASLYRHLRTVSGQSAATWSRISEERSISSLGHSVRTIGQSCRCEVARSLYLHILRHCIYRASSRCRMMFQLGRGTVSFEILKYRLRNVSLYFVGGKRDKQKSRS